MKYRRQAIILLLVFALFLGELFSTPQPAHAAVSLPPLWDTAWTLNLSNQTTINTYLTARKSQEFDAVLMGFGDFGARNTALGNGATPFLGTVPSSVANVSDVLKPNAAGWSYIDSTLSSARDKGLTVGFLPLGNGGATTYVDALKDRYSGENRAYKYGVWLGNRYKNAKNFIWVLGGDVNPNEDPAVVTLTNSLASGIRSTGDSHPMTFQPSNSGTNSVHSSSYNFNSQSWLTFNSIQSTPLDPGTITHDIALNKPTGVLETGYEGKYTSSDILKFTWQAYFSGATYMTYGQTDMYQGQNAANTNGIKYSKIARDLVVSRGWLSYTPTSDFITSKSSTVASMRKSNSAAMIYLGSDASATVDMSKLNANTSVTVQCLDPTTGNVTTVSTYPASGTQSLTGGGLSNAVLLLDASAATGETTPPPPTTTFPAMRGCLEVTKTDIPE